MLLLQKQVVKLKTNNTEDNHALGTDKRAAHGVSLFLVDADSKGFHKGRKLKKLGLKAQDTAELFFEDVRVPGTALLGGENKGFYQLMEQLPQERLLIGVASIAHCEALFESTREWVKQRKAFGRRVADLQTVQHKLAEIKETFLNHKV